MKVLKVIMTKKVEDQFNNIYKIPFKQKIIEILYEKKRYGS